MSSFLRLGVAASGLGGLGTLFLFRDDLKKRFNTEYSKQDANANTNPPSKQKLIIEDLPEHIPYLLVGGGASSYSAMRSIRGHDPLAKVLIVSNENHLPYMRPALSKELWTAERDLRQQLKFQWYNGKNKSVYFEEEEFFLPLKDMVKRDTGGVSVLKNTRLLKLDPSSNTAYFDSGQIIKYDKCLLAPGGKPRSLPQFDSVSREVQDRTIYYRTVDDFMKLDKASQTAKNIVIVGGGFLGSELAFALKSKPIEETKQTSKDQIITQIFPESGNLGKVLPDHLSKHVTTTLEKNGVKVVPNVEVKSAVWNDIMQEVDITLSNNEVISADYIVAAVGLDPDVELARASKLEVDDRTGGYLVNAELEARTNVWVAGDASCFYDTLLGRRRIEHHDHAIHSGRVAGLNMMGKTKPYTYQPMFWSDLGTQFSFEAVGLIDSSLNTVSVFAKEDMLPKVHELEQGGVQKETAESGTKDAGELTKMKEGEDKCEKGVVFYLKDDVIVGILTWNLFSRLTAARRIINEQIRYDDFVEVSKLFNIFYEDD